MAKKRSLEERLAEAERLVGRIATEHAKARQAVQGVLKELSAAQKVNRDFQALKPGIDKITSLAKTALDTSKADRESLAKLVVSTSQFLTKKFDPLVTKVMDPESGLAARVKEGTQYSKNLESLKSGTEKQVQLITALVKKAEESNAELTAVVKSCHAVKRTVEDEAKAIIAKRQIVEQELRKVEAAAKNIDTQDRDIRAKREQVVALYTECETKHGAIVEWNAQAEQTLEKIKRIYDIAANTGLGGEFDKRRGVLDKEGDGWRKQVFRTTALLLGMIIGLFLMELGSKTTNWDMSKLTFDSHFYVRFLITSPVIFYLVFATRQYVKTRAMHERYAFKTTMALSIEAHMNLLLNNPAVREKEMLPSVINFILEGFGTIYREPYPVPKYKEPKESTKDTAALLKAASELIHGSKE